VTRAAMNALRGLSWAALQRKALDAGVPLGKVRAAATRDALRLLIVAATS
jgi:hypothetical protein